MNQTVIDAIKNRRSYRAYEDKPVPEDILKEIAELAVQAPSARNAQPWRITVVSDSEWLDAFDKDGMANLIANTPGADPKRKLLHGAPAAIFVFADESTGWGETDCGMLAQTVMLVAEAYGLASCIVGMIRATLDGPNAEKFLADLGAEKGWKPMYAITLGYPGCERPEARPRDLGKITYKK